MLDCYVITGEASKITRRDVSAVSSGSLRGTSQARVDRNRVRNLGRHFLEGFVWRAFVEGRERESEGETGKDYQVEYFCVVQLAFMWRNSSGVTLY